MKRYGSLLVLDSPMLAIVLTMLVIGVFLALSERVARRAREIPPHELPQHTTPAGGLVLRCVPSVDGPTPSGAQLNPRLTLRVP